MKSLVTGKLYIKDVFGKSRFYRIPEYQRPYVWGTRQIIDLLNDISSAMEEDTDKEYFIGCMIWNIVDDSLHGYQFQCQDILDGQQRFISLFLLQAVLRDLSWDEALKVKVRARLQQEEDSYDKIPARNRVLFAVRGDEGFLNEWVLADDKSLDSKELTRIGKDETRTVSVRGMAQGLVDMRAWWAQKLEELESEEAQQQYVSRFFTYLSNNVLALFLATPDNLDDAYNLFTVLNSRGLQLRAGDILKAQNLRRVDNDSKRRLFSREWDANVDSIRSPLSSFDELLKYIVFAKVKFTSDKTRTLSAGFDYLFDRGTISRGEGFFRIVSRYSNHFTHLADARRLDIPEATQTDFENIFFILSQTFGSQFVMPLMHYRELFGDDQIFEFLVKLDNLASMAWILGRRTLRQRLFLLVRRMDECAKIDRPLSENAAQFLSDEVFEYGFQYQTSKTAMSLEEFRAALDEEHWGAYGGTRLNKPRYLLLKLDLLHGNSLTRLSFNRAASSIEHLLPRNPQGGVAEEDTLWHQDLVHRLGNLALLDRKKNSSLSNSNFAEKKRRYQGAFETRPYTNSVFLRHDSWGRAELERQHEYAISTLIDYYRENSATALLAARSARSRVAAAAGDLTEA